MSFLLVITILAQTMTIDWDALPLLPFRAAPVATQEMNAFAIEQDREGNCDLPDGELRVDVAVLLDEEDSLRAAVPRAINCPAIEQYVVSVITASARNNLLPRVTPNEQWHRASITFNLTK